MRKVNISDIVMMKPGYSWGTCLVQITEVRKNHVIGRVIDYSCMETDFEYVDAGPQLVISTNEVHLGWAFAYANIMQIVEKAQEEA